LEGVRRPVDDAVVDDLQAASGGDDVRAMAQDWRTPAGAESWSLERRLP
jgi:hypothetical protein